MADMGSYPCVNRTRNKSEFTPGSPHQQLTHVIIAVAVTLGVLAVLTLVVSIWLIVRRRKLNNKADRISELSDEDTNIKRSDHETIRVMSMTRIDMYGGSLDDLRRLRNDREKLHLTKTSLHSSSHQFLNRGNHNNTILSTLCATWSIQTLPNPPLPGDTVVTKTTTNPLYDRLTLNQLRKCTSSSTLYESVSNLFPGDNPENLPRDCKKCCSRSPIYQSIDELNLKSPTTRHTARQDTHYERVDLHGSAFAPTKYKMLSSIKDN